MFTMRIEGGEELARRLNALASALTMKIVMSALYAGAEPMRARMSQLCVRAPGAPDIADNIGVSAATRLGSTGGGRWRAREEGEYAVAIGPTKAFFYGLFLEYGTVKMSARPFMRPAFDAVAPQSLGIIGQQLWDALRDTANRGPSFGGGRFSNLPMAA